MPAWAIIAVPGVALSKTLCCRFELREDEGYQ